MIEDTRYFGTYTKGGFCEKVDLVEKIRLISLEDQLVKRHSDAMLFAKAVIAFYQSKGKIPGLFDEANEEEWRERMRLDYCLLNVRPTFHS